MVPKGEKSISMLSGPPSAATEREGATNNRIAIAAATARKGLGETEPAEDVGELLISVASAGPVLRPLKSRAKAVPRSTITGHPVYSSGCPEVVRW
jgi:hypothetical protein